MPRATPDGADAMTLTVGTLFLLVVIGAAAGLLGALVGIGGGVVLVPTLVLGFGVDLRDAVAVSLVAVVATSTAAGSVYVGEGLANMRLGMTLEVATTIGGMTGGFLALVVPTSLLSGLFAVILVGSAILLVRGREPEGDERGTALAVTPDGERRGSEEPGRLAGAYFDEHAGQMVHYEAQRLGLGSAIALVAGAISGMLGVGGGFLKVPAMTLGMRVPMRVAAATSNFMIGVTAIASLSVYLVRGHVRPMLAAPLALGVIAGSLVGTTAARRVHVKLLRIVLAIVLAFVAVQMGVHAFGVSLGR